MGAAGSETEYKGEILKVPAYFVANAGVSRDFRLLELFFKVENMLDASYETEPGFPMKSRTFRVGVNFRVSAD
jgi:hypothetical protein